MAEELFDQPLRQPDQRSCGAAVLVVHELLRRPGYAAVAGTPSAFRQEVLAMHRRVTSASDLTGHAQLPWPRAFGTPPWAVANQLAATSGTEHGTHWAGPDRGGVFDRLVGHVDAGRPVPAYVGSTWLPRHVVLALDSPGADALRVYEPASGVPVVVTRERFVAARLGLAGWDRPWFVVAPRG